MKNILLAGFLIAGCVQSAFAQAPWVIDSTFNSDGKAIRNYGFQDNLTAVAVQPDDQKIVVAGTAINQTTFGGQLLIARYLTNGLLDPSFNDSGSVILTNFTESYAYACSILPNGKILIAGAAANPQYQFSMLVIRLNPNGSFDTSFGTNGVVQTDFTPSDEFAYAMAIQPDNKIILAGSAGDVDYKNMPAIVRLYEDGGIDSTFGTNGITYFPVTEIDNDFSSVIIQSNGGIIASGHWDQGLTDGGQQNFDVLIARVDEAGQPDAAFGTNGYTTTPVSPQYSEEAYGMLLTSDGSIALCGYTLAADLSYNIILVKYKSNGELETGFGTNGYVIFDRTTGDVAYDMVLQGDRLLVTGAIGNSFAELDYLLVRFENDGNVDSTFGTNGIIRTDILGDFDESNALTIQNDGRIVLAGKGSNLLNNDAVVVRYTNEPNLGMLAPLSQESSLRAYPNPVIAGNYIQVRWEGIVSSNVALELFTLKGQRVMKTMASSSNTNNNMLFEIPSELSEGLYLLRMNTGLNSTSIRISITK